MSFDLKLAIQDLIASAETKEKPIADTGEYDELKEKAIRDLATRVGAYAESGPTFDPDGQYLCGALTATTSQ